MLSQFELKNKDIPVAYYNKRKHTASRIDKYLNDICNEISKIQMSSESVDMLVKLLMNAGIKNNEIMIMGFVGDMHMISHANADFVNTNGLKTICMGIPEMTAFANDYKHPASFSNWLLKRGFSNGSILIGVQLDKPGPLLSEAFNYNRKNNGINVLITSSIGIYDNVDVLIPVHSNNTLAACDIVQLIFHYLSANIAFKTNCCYPDKGAGSLNDYCGLLLQSINSSSYSIDILTDITMLIDKKIKNGKSVFTFGNGGSAAIAAYFADGLKAALKGNPKYKRNIINAPSFASDIVNSLDKGMYKSVFTKVLKSLGVEDDDILIGISSSGNSENIVHPMIEIPGVNRVGILGFDNGGVIGQSGMAQNAFVVPDCGGFKSYQRAEDGQRIALSSILSSL